MSNMVIQKGLGNKYILHLKLNTLFLYLDKYYPKLIF